MAIFLGKFKPKHLVKLRHLYNYDDDDKDQMFSITHDGAITIKNKKYIKDFRQDLSIWQEGFLNYALILVTLFGNQAPSLFRALTCFSLEIARYACIYQWREVVLPMALDHHQELANHGKVTTRPA
jgi:hypothetical protein